MILNQLWCHSNLVSVELSYVELGCDNFSFVGEEFITQTQAATVVQPNLLSSCSLSQIMVFQQVLHLHQFQFKFHQINSRFQDCKFFLILFKTKFFLQVFGLQWHFHLQDLHHLLGQTSFTRFFVRLSFCLEWLYCFIVSGSIVTVYPCRAQNWGARW